MKTSVKLTLSTLFLLLLASNSLGQAANRKATARFFDPLRFLSPQHNLGVEGPRSGGTPASSLTAVAPSAKVYTFESVDFPGAAGSVLYGSNGKTDVGAFSFDPNQITFLPFTHTGTKSQIVTVPDSTFSTVYGINSEGVMVGLYIDPSNIQHGFIDKAGSFSPLDPPGSLETSATGISDTGSIAGTWQDDQGQTHGFLYSGGVFTTLDYPGAVVTAASGVNGLGQVVGRWFDSNFAVHGFLWSNGNFTNLDFPGALRTEAKSINDAGKIVGYYQDASSAHGFLYQNNFTTVDVAGAKHTFLYHIDNKSKLAGFFEDQLAEFHGFTGR